jgi:ketosteroid isomerase-like protein
MDTDRAALERFRIHERVYLYQDLLNHRDWERYEDLWTEDAIFSQTIDDRASAQADLAGKKLSNVNVRREGRAAIMEMLTAYVRYDFVFQMAHGVVVELDSPTTARSRHTLQVLGPGFMTIGLYYDRLVKEADGIWRFCRRDFRVTYHDGTSATGDIYRTLPDPDYRRMPLD